MTDTLDVLTLDEARSAIGANNQDYDPELAVMNTAVAQIIDDISGPVVARTVTERYDGGRSELLLRSRPLYAVTSLSLIHI